MDKEMVMVFAFLSLVALAAIGVVYAGEVARGNSRRERAHALAELDKLRRDEAKTNGGFMRLLGRPADSNPFNPNEGHDGIALCNAWLAGWTATDVNLRDLARKEQQATEAEVASS